MLGRGLGKGDAPQTEHRVAPPSVAIGVCRDLTRAHSKTFYLGSRFFPVLERQAVWAVYAACRSGDDIADELEAPQARIQLEAWWDGIQRVYERPTQRVADPLFQSLHWAVSQYPIPLSAFQELYLGLQMDLENHRYTTLADLELYCRRVAGVVGWLIAPICGYSGGDRTLEQALMLGKAMQLTNILRDVGEDRMRGRLYLPLELRLKHGVTDSMLEKGVVTPQYRALMLELSALARSWYKAGEAGIPRLRGSGRLAVLVAARAYEGILDSLERNDFDNFSKRAYVSGRKKLLLIPQAWWTLRGL